MTKIYYGRDLIGRFTCDGKKYTKVGYQIMLATRMTQLCLTIASVLVIGAWLVTGGIFIAKATLEPKTVWGREVIEIPIVEVPLIMKRIADCESGKRLPSGRAEEGSARHFDSKGKVITGVNKDGSIDIGKYQINTVHLAEIARMNLNVYDEKDNEAFALYLHDQRGTSDWYSSADCWKR